MTLISGISYNFKGLILGLKTPRLLMLGITRLVITLVFAVIAIAIVLNNYQEITNLIVPQPSKPYLLWLWHAASWVIALLLSAISSILGFLISQILFSILIMDYMSRITELKVSGKEVTAPNMPWFSYFIFLFKQEIPRATIPVIISMGVMMLGWLTPLSPLLTILSPVVAGTFLAWDNTDLVPARRLETFRHRIRFLRKHLKFHIGFGLGFLIPGLNILLLSFAPVGATLFHIELVDAKSRQRPPA